MENNGEVPQGKPIQSKNTTLIKEPIPAPVQEIVPPHGSEENPIVLPSGSQVVLPPELQGTPGEIIKVPGNPPPAPEQVSQSAPTPQTEISPHQESQTTSGIFGWLRRIFNKQPA